MEGADDASHDEMAEATEGLAGLHSKLAAADETWAAGGGASRLVPATVLGSDKRGGAVPEHASMLELDPGTEENGGAMPHVQERAECAHTERDEVPVRTP